MVAYLAPIQAEIVISSGCNQQIHVTDPAQIVNEQVRKEGRQIDGAFADQLLHNRGDLRQTGFGFPTVYPHLTCRNMKKANRKHGQAEYQYGQVPMGLRLGAIVIDGLLSFVYSTVPCKISM